MPVPSSKAAALGTASAPVAGWLWAVLGAGVALVLGGLVLVLAVRTGRARPQGRREAARG